MTARDLPVRFHIARTWHHAQRNTLPRKLCSRLTCFNWSKHAALPRPRTLPRFTAVAGARLLTQKPQSWTPRDARFTAFWRAVIALSWALRSSRSTEQGYVAHRDFHKRNDHTTPRRLKRGLLQFIQLSSLSLIYTAEHRQKWQWQWVNALTITRNHNPRNPKP